MSALPDDNCPKCRRDIGGTMLPGDESARPSAGDLSVCTYCGAFLVFTPQLRSRELTEGELAALSDAERAQLHRVRAMLQRFTRRGG